VTRWWFILLAVVLGWFTPAHAFAHTRAIAYDVGPSSEKVVSVAGITMDTYQGNNQDPLSLHKYIYCQGNPGNGIDPSGHGEDVDVMAGSFGSVAVDGFSAAADMAAKKGMQLTIQQIGLGLAATTLLMEELGFGGGDTVATMQTQIAQRDNPTRSTYAYQNYKCVQFAQDAKKYFTQKGQNPQIITYDSYKDKTVGDNIVVVQGFGFFGMLGFQNISVNGHHEGVLVGGEVYDNNVPFGVPRTLWENGYLIGPRDRPGTDLTLRQAHDYKYGVLNPD